MLNWISLLPTPPPLSFPPPRHVASYSPAACLLRLCIPSMKHRTVAVAAAGARCQSLPNHPPLCPPGRSAHPLLSCPTHHTATWGSQAPAPSQDTWAPAGAAALEDKVSGSWKMFCPLKAPTKGVVAATPAMLQAIQNLKPVLCSSSLGYWTALCLFQDESSQPDFSGLVSLWLALSWSFTAVGVAPSISIRAT